MTNFRRLILIFTFLVSLEISTRAQTVNNNERTDFICEYPFIIQDSPSLLFTMRQVNQDYLSGYRLLSMVLSDNLKPTYNYLIQSAGFVLFFGTMTHEEAHRSVLNTKNIGSISRPFLLSERNGYVFGVTDIQLKNIRDTDFPTYAHLYTAGFESDYMLNHHEESLLSFGDERFKNIAVEYLLRKVMLVQYFLIGFIHYDIDETEETDELKRDIVGNDIYGVVRHWYRPAMEFKRYTLYNDLTAEEKSFLKRMGFRSLLNFVNPNLIGIRNFPISSQLSINTGLGYTLAPFGDFIDENLWINYNHKFKISAYFRQFQNKNNWYPATGLGIDNFVIVQRLSANIRFHTWKQPENLSFAETKSFFGGAIDSGVKYIVFTSEKEGFKSMSVDLGLLCKTKGFLPEELVLGKQMNFRIGITFSFDKP